jgi:hypothetical protein
VLCFIHQQKVSGRDLLLLAKALSKAARLGTSSALCGSKHRHGVEAWGCAFRGQKVAGVPKKLVSYHFDKSESQKRPAVFERFATDQWIIETTVAQFRPMAP